MIGRDDIPTIEAIRGEVYTLEQQQADKKREEEEKREYEEYVKRYREMWGCTPIY